MALEQWGDGYPVPAATCEVEYEIKKSRFIARVYPAASRAAAMEFIDQCRTEFPDARHHCWAFVVGPPRSPLNVAQSDDGEPTGTAGKPILNVLEHKQVGDILLVVIRYFGGIKLGAGGLVRAYSQAAQSAMSALELRDFVPQADLVYVGDFSQEQAVRQWLAGRGGEVLDVTYGEGIRCTIRLPRTRCGDFADFAAGLGGRVSAVDGDTVATPPCD